MLTDNRENIEDQLFYFHLDFNMIMSIFYSIIALILFSLVYIVGLVGNGLLICKLNQK